MLNELPRSVVGWDRVQRVLQATGAQEHGAGALPADGGAAGLDVAAVSFSYGDAAGARRGQLRRPARPDGRAGRPDRRPASRRSPSVLVRLLDPDTGRVAYDDVDVRALAPGRRRRGGLARAAVDVPVRRHGPRQRHARRRHARRATSGRRCASRRPTASSPRCRTALDTVVGERGTTLSGGQRQRLALARAVVRRPRLLVLDDATSSVDPQVEQRILAGLRGGTSARGRRSTVVVIAYRRATIALADEVVFVEDGRIAARGTHAELLATLARLPGPRARLRAGRGRARRPTSLADDAPREVAARDRRRHRCEPPATRSTAAAPSAAPRDARRTACASRPSCAPASASRWRSRCSPRPGASSCPSPCSRRSTTACPARSPTCRSSAWPAAWRCSRWSSRRCANYLTNVRLYRTTENGLAALRVRAFRRVHDLSVLHQAAERRGSLVSRVTSDVDTMSTFMQWGGLLILVSTAQLTLATVLMLFWSWQLTLVVYLCFLPLVFAVRSFQQRLQAAYGAVRAARRRDARRRRRVGRRRAGHPRLRRAGPHGRAHRRGRRRDPRRADRARSASPP